MASPAPATVTSSPRLHRIPCNAPLRPEQRTAQMQPARAQRTARASITAHIANNPHPVQRRAPATSPPRIATTHRAPTAHDARARRSTLRWFRLVCFVSLAGISCRPF